MATLNDKNNTSPPWNNYGNNDAIIARIDLLTISPEADQSAPNYTGELDINVVLGNSLPSGGVMSYVDWFRVPVADEAQDYRLYTGDDFTDGYNAAASQDRGDWVIRTQERDQIITHTATENGIYWYRVTAEYGGETYEAIGRIAVDTLYDPQPVYLQGVLESDGETLYPYSVLGFDLADESTWYGLAYDLHGQASGTVIDYAAVSKFENIARPSLGVHSVELADHESYQQFRANWTGRFPNNNTSSMSLRLDGDFLRDPYGYGDEGNIDRYTARYTKTAGMWEDFPVVFVNQEGARVQVDGRGGETISIPKEPAPLTGYQEFRTVGGSYLPPNDDVYTALGYTVAASWPPSNLYQPVSDFASSAFNPKPNDSGETIYIVYSADGIAIPETHVDVNSGQVLQNTVTAVDFAVDTQYATSQRTIPGYVPVKYEVTGSNSGAHNATYTFQHSSSGLAIDASQQNYSGFALTLPLTALAAETKVTYYYEEEIFPGTGIPKSAGATVHVKWVGQLVNGWKTNIKTETKYSRAGNLVVANDGAGGSQSHQLADSNNNPSKWWFDDTQPNASGNHQQTAVIQAPGDTMTISFYYDYDTKGNGCKDKEQYREERYVLYNSGAEIAAATSTLVLDGDPYTKTPPTIVGSDGKTYLPVGWYRGRYDQTLINGFANEQAHQSAIDHIADGTETFSVNLSAQATDQTYSYIYRPAATTTVRLKGITSQEQALPTDLGTYQVSGWVGEDVTQRIRALLLAPEAGKWYVSEVTVNGQVQTDSGGNPVVPDGLLLTDPGAQVVVTYVEQPQVNGLQIQYVDLGSNPEVIMYQYALDMRWGSSAMTFNPPLYYNNKILKSGKLTLLDPDDGSAINTVALDIQFDYNTGTAVVETAGGAPIQPDDGPQVLALYYEDYYEEVEIYAVDWHQVDWNTLGGAATDAEIIASRGADSNFLYVSRVQVPVGSDFTGMPLAQNGYLQVDRNNTPVGSPTLGSQTITVKKGNGKNQILFFYCRAESGHLIYHIDKERYEQYQGDPAQSAAWLIFMESQEIAAGSTGTIASVTPEYYENTLGYVLDLDYATYDETAIQPAASVSISYEGGDEQTVSFFYERKKADVTLTARKTSPNEAILYPADDPDPLLAGQEITVTTSAQRVGEYLQYDNYLNGQGQTKNALQEIKQLVDSRYQGYSLVQPATTNMLVAESGLDNQITAWFQPPADGFIKVVAQIDNPQNEELFQYLIPAVPGETVTLSEAAGQIPTIRGFVYDETKSQNTASEGGTITLVYTDHRHTVTVKTITVDKDGNETENPLAASYKVVAGDTLPVPVLYLSNYVLDTYQIGEAGTPQEGRGRDFVPVTPTGDTVVILRYMTVDKASDENFVNITIRGVSGVLTHYRYVLRLPKSDTPFTLLDGTHIFNVPGYLLDDGQPHIITPNQDNDLTFTYTSTEGVVRIVLQDEQGNPVGAGSWSEAATVDDPFTYLAPQVDGYLLVETAPALSSQSSIGYVTQVAADNSSQIVFTYRPITADVVIVCYDAGTGEVIRLKEVTSPTVGTDIAIAAPDLSAEYYTPVPGQETLTYDYNGSDSVRIDAYYDKDRATIRIIGVDVDTSLEIAGTEEFLSDQRKGEVITVNAPATPAWYQLREANRRLVLVDPTIDPDNDQDQEEIFYFKSIAETYVPVQVVDAATGQKLQNYGISAITNEVVTVDPTLIQIAGYVYDPTDSNNQSILTATAGDGNQILVMLTDIRKVLTVSLVDEEDGGVLGGSVERIVAGTLKTIYPTYVNGYVLIGYKLDDGGAAPLVAVDESFTGITEFAGAGGFADDHTVTFVYRKISDYIDGRARSIAVRGVDAVSGEQLYAYTISGDDDTTRLVEPLHVPHYRALDTAKTAHFGQDSQLEFRYESEFAKVLVEAVDETGQAIVGHYAKSYAALIGERYTAYAPVIDGWVIRDTGSADDYQQTETIAAGGHTFTFTYVKAEGLVLVKAVEASNPTNVLRVVGLELTDGSHTIDATATLGALTGWTVSGPDQAQITVPEEREVVFAYEQKDVTITVRYLDQADPTGLTEILGPNTFSAPEGSLFTAAMEPVTGWQLAADEAVTKTVYAADGAELAFSYVISGANVVVVHKDQDTGAVLDIDYRELRAGEGYSVSAIDFTGYQVVTPAVVSGAAPTDGSVTVVEFGYTSLLTDITVLLLSGTTLLGSDIVSGPVNVAKTIAAPHIAGYTINGDATKTITPTLLGPNMIAFQYRSVDDVSEENRVTITVQGVTTTTAEDGSSVTHTHYSYDRRLLNSSEALILVNGADVFAVPGYVLEDGQDSKYTVYPTEDQVITFAYKSTQGAVKITMEEQGTGTLVGQGSFYVEATVDSPFTFPAPYVDGYTVVAVTPAGPLAGSTIGTISAVQANAVNEIVFVYEKITSLVTIVCKEDDTNGQIIHQEGLVNPAVGGDSFVALDLSANYYTLADPASPSIFYDFDGINPLVVEVYYTKELVDLELEGRDGKTGALLETYTLEQQRKGEMATLLAEWVEPAGSYVLIDQPSRIVIADDDLTEVFLYHSLAESSVMVRVYVDAKDPDNEIYSYVIPATAGDPVTIDPVTIQLAGYVLDDSHGDNRYTVTAGDGRDIVVIMTDVRKTLTTNYTDEQGETILAATTEKLVAGTLKTVYPAYVSDYVLVGYQLDDRPGTGDLAYVEIDETFTGIVDFTAPNGSFDDDHTVTFVYRNMADYIDGRARSVTVRGVDEASKAELYTYTLSGDDGRSQEIRPIHVPRYTAADSTKTVAFGRDSQVEFAYTSKLATVTITAVDANGEAIAGYHPKTYEAVIGDQFTAYAPVIDGWVVQDTGNLDDYEITSQITAGANHFTFRYVPSAGMVLVKAVAADDADNVLRVVGLSLADGSHIVEADTLGELTGWTLTDSQTKPVLVPEENEVIFQFEPKLVTVTVRGITPGDPPQEHYRHDHQVPEGSQFTGAMDFLTDWQLAEGQPVSQTIYATDGAEIVFEYAAITGNVIVVHKDQATGAILDIDYLDLEAGAMYSVNAIQFTGYQVIGDSVKTVQVPASGRKIIEFLYESQAAVITVELWDSKENQLVDSYQTAGLKGVSQTLFAPPLAGYVITGNGSEHLTPTGDGALDVVRFYYLSVQDYVDDNFVTITVRGWVENDNTPLYSYTQVRQAGSGPYPVTAMDTVGFVLAAGETGQETLYVQEEDLIHTFWYTPLATAVTIMAELEDGAAVPGFTDIQVAATIGQPFSYNAPYIPGYNLVGDITQYLNPVTGTGQTLTFTYSQADGNVVILLKEGDENGAVIRTMSDKLEVGETRIYEIADPRYDLSRDHYYPVNDQQRVAITNDGTAQTVELYYTKALSSLFRAEYDVTTSRSLIGGPTLLAEDYRVGELATVNALALNDPAAPYELVSTTPQLVIVDADADQTIEFEYKSIAARDVVVEAVLAGENGQNTVLQSHTVTSTEGRRVTVAAPSLTGYRLADGQEATGSAEAPGKITFVYVEDRVTISVSLQDVYGNALTGPAGYEAVYTVPHGLDHTVYAPHVAGFVITDRQSETYTQIDADQYPVFTYRTVDEESDLGHVDIRIQGVTGDYVHYSYLRRFAKSDLATSLSEGLDLFYVNGYRLTPGQELAVIPNRDYPVISFAYEPNLALVEIAAVYDDGVYETPVESFTTIHVEAEIGKPFTFITPDIDGYVATGSSGMLGEVSGDRSLDRITFYYQRGEGNVTVIAREGREPIGRYYTSLSIGDTVDVTRGGSMDPDASLIDALQYYEPTAAPGVADYNAYDGVNPVTVTFQFTKKTAPVTLIAMNTELDEEITRLALEAQRVLEAFDFAGQLGELDALVESLLPEALRVSGSTTHVVAPESGENEILVWYVPAATSAVTVELWIEEPGSGELIQSYYLPATKNGTVSLRTGQIPDLSGLGLTYDSTRSTTSAVEGTGEKILLVYQDRRVDVNVYIVKDIGVASPHRSQKAVIGTDVLVTAPYLSGYVLRQYQISGSAPESLPDAFEGVKITGIATSYDVIFYYQHMDDYVQEEYVNIIVRGLAQGSRTELYSHVVTVPKQDEVVELEAFTVSGYDLVGEAVAPVRADGSQTLVEFLYRSRQTSVSIRALLESGEPVPQFSEVTVTAELGQPFTYNAPYILGYELVDRQSLIGMIESVSESDNTIDFYYQRATGDLTVLLVEVPATGESSDDVTILAHFQERLAEEEPTLIPVPDLSAQYYLALDDPETVTYTGSALTVTYRYAKRTREVVAQIYDVTDPANEILLEEITSGQRYRVGEVAAIAAPAYSGYKLVSPAVQYVLIEAPVSAGLTEPEAEGGAGSELETYGGAVVAPEVESEAVILRQEVVPVAPAVETTEEAVEGAEEPVVEAPVVSAASRSAKRATENVRLTLTSASFDADAEAEVGADAGTDADVDTDATTDADTSEDVGADPTAETSEDADAEAGDEDQSPEDLDADDPEGAEEPDGGADDEDDDDEEDDRDGEDEDDEGNGQEPDEEPQAVCFEYTTAAENEIVINAIEDETNQLLYSYTLTGPTGESRTINAPRLAGYALAGGEEQAVVQIISGVVEFRYTQDLVVVTYRLVDENGEIIDAPDWLATSYNVARGANYTAYAPHIPGYALTGQQNQSLINVVEPQEVTFTYRYDGSDQSRPAEVTVHYLKAEDQATVIKTEHLTGYYMGERFLLLSSLPESFNFGGRKYRLDGELTVIEPTYLLAENEFYAYYKDNGSESSGGGGGGGNYTTAILTVHGVDVRTGNLIYNQSVTVIVGSKETVKAPTISGYSLDAASESSQVITIVEGTNLVTFNYNYTGGEVEMSAGLQLSRDLLNRDDHYAYISGYPDQTVRPEDSITREEVAAIFYRILKDETRNSYFSQTNRFRDVSYGWWSNDSISTVANLGIVEGDPEGTFRPGDNITRAEMAVIVAKFSGGGTGSTGDQFSDIGVHWANGYINRAANAGWINGDNGAGSTFRPDDNMSRAEVMALVNQLLDRIPPTSVSDLDSGMIQWIDNRDASKWYYFHVQEASNSHEYEAAEKGPEKWNGLRTNRNWS